MNHFIDELRRRNVLRVASLYATGAWVILQVLITTRQYLNIPYDLIRGNLQLSCEYFMREYRRSPKDVYINGAAISEALLAANDPRKVLSIGNKIDPLDIQYNTCAYCRQRLEMIVAAYVDLGKYRKVKKILDKIIQTSFAPYTRFTRGSDFLLSRFFVFNDGFNH